MNGLTGRGSLLWLLRHEFRLLSRESSSSRWVWWVLLAIAFFGIAGAFYARSLLPSSFGGLPATLPPQVMAYIGAGVFLVFTILSSVTVRSAVQVLFERGDVDLLLSSPLHPRTVLAAKGVWVMLTALSSLAFIVVPVTVGAAIFLGWRVLGVLPLLIALALIGAALGLVITLALVRAIGARRARTVAQVVGVLFGAGIYLLTQLGRFINPDSAPWLVAVEAYLETIPADSPLLIPARAALFEPLPSLLMLGIGIALFYASVQVTHRAFLTGATAGLGGSRARVSKNTKVAPFRPGAFWNVLVKEWRLIFRDPLLISRTLQQLIYLVPIAIALFSGSRSSAGIVGFYAFLAFAAIFIGGSLAQNLTQIVIAAEDAPELLRMSPTKPATLRWAKLVAAITPTWAVFAPIILYRTLLEPQTAFILIGFAAVTVLGGLMMLWTARPFNRADLQKRRRDSQGWQIGLALFVFDAAVLAALLAPGWWGVGAGVIAALIPFGTWLIAGRKENAALGY